MKMSVAEIVQQACSNLNFPYGDLSSLSFFTTTEMLRWFNMAQGDFVRYTRGLRYEWVFPTTKNQQEYALATDVGIMDIIGCLCDAKTLIQTEIRDLSVLRKDWRYEADGATGTPEFYYIGGIKDSELGFYPTPDSIYTITLSFVENPPVISTISSTAYPKIDDQWDDALSFYMEWMGHRKKKDYAGATDARRQYYEIRERAKNYYKLQTMDKTRIMSGPEYLPSGSGRPSYPPGYGKVE